MKGEKQNMEEREDNTIYKVVVNHEEQYSIWPATGRMLSAGTIAERAGPRPTVWPISKRFGQTCGR